MFDIAIKGGRVIDGTGNPWFKSDVAIEGNRIATIGKLDFDAEEVIDAKGLVVAPGFIDTHSHSDLMLMVQPQAKQKIMQGITTEIVGQDGLGEAPLRDDVVDDWRKYLAGLNGDPDIKWSWRTFSEYLGALESARPSINVASLVGHGNIRLLAMGMENRAPSTSEIEKMRTLVDVAMEQGAFGLSTGLIYAPCVYANTDELVELCRTASNHRGIFVVHMRNEGDQLLESIDEVVTIGKKSGIPVHISHFKASGKQNWWKAILALDSVNNARSEGVDVTFDQYPYTAGSTFLSSLLPAWVHDGGTIKLLQRLKNEETRGRIRLEMADLRGAEMGWDSVYVTSVKSEANKRFEGKTIPEIARERERTAIDTIMDLTVEEENAATMVGFSMSEDGVRTIMQSPLQMVCTDGIVLGKPHPRAYGSFPRVLGLYVREGVVRLEDAVRKMTSLPAQRFSLSGRGLLRPGMFADITIFDPRTVVDKATYSDPIQFPEGIEHVIVNGQITVKDGVHTGTRAGEVLRHKSSEKP